MFQTANKHIIKYTIIIIIVITIIITIIPIVVIWLFPYYCA